jgi:PAS domain S-box-containing protein
VRILHIEEDPSFADLVSTFLERERDGFEVVTETDPRDGIERLGEIDVDCVISDYDMPGMNGLEVLETARRDHPKLPFVLFTGKGSEEIASDAISAGVTEYLQKAGGTEQYKVLANRIEQAVARYRAEQQVERGFRAIETVYDGISLLNEDGRFIYLNEAYTDILGYERDELIGERFEVVFRDENVDRAYEEICPIAKEDQWQGQSDFVQKTGDVVPVDHTLAFTSEDTMICTISEIEEAEVVREELTLKERAMDEAPVGITITDPSGTDNPMIYVNEGFAELTGYACDEVLGRNHRFLQGPETLEEPVTELRRAIDAREPVSLELRNYRKDGEMFWNRVTIAPLFDENGTLDHFVGFQEDVTARRELLNEFSSLSSVLSHDMRNPLQTIRGRLEMAVESESIEHVESAMASVDRLEQLIVDIANILDTGTIVGQQEEIYVNWVAESVWEALDICAETDSIEIDGSPEVYGDREAVRRMLGNLLGNSLEHGEGDVNVRVGEFEEGFYVEDDGPGIPEENRENVFEQGFSTKESDEGTGLGMASVRQIVLAHGWRIRVTDAEKLDGVRFEIQTE